MVYRDEVPISPSYWPYSEITGWRKDMQRYAKYVFEDLAARGIISWRAATSKVKKYYPSSYTNEKGIMRSMTVYEACKNWNDGKTRQVVTSTLKWHHYFKDRGLCESAYKRFEARLWKCTDGCDVAILILRTKALLHKNNKNNHLWRMANKKKH